LWLDPSTQIDGGVNFFDPQTVGLICTNCKICVSCTKFHKIKWVVRFCIPTKSYHTLPIPYHIPFLFILETILDFFGKNISDFFGKNFDIFGKKVSILEFFRKKKFPIFYSKNKFLIFSLKKVSNLDKNNYGFFRKKNSDLFWEIFFGIKF
jgi:hypothetical protein